MEIPRKLALYVFNLKEDYTTQELKEASKKLAMISHPDSGGTNNLFAFINDCNEVLQQDNKNSNSNQNNTKSSSSNTQKTTNSYEFITLSELYELYAIIKESDDPNVFKNIISKATISIAPIFNRSLRVEHTHSLSRAYADFLKYAKDYLFFSVAIYLPERFDKYHFFKITLFIEEKKYVFLHNIRRVKTISSKNAFKKDMALPYKFLTTLTLTLWNSDDADHSSSRLWVHLHIFYLKLLVFKIKQKKCFTWNISFAFYLIYNLYTLI